MRRTLHFAWRCACVNNLLAVCAVVHVEMLFSPGLVEGLTLVRFGVGAELGAELERAHLAVFDALTAGDALVFINAGNIVRAEHIRIVEVFAQTESQT